MEEALVYKISLFEDAVKDFENSLNIDLTQFNDVVVDTLKSGQVQKFEICAELMWKTVKAFLSETNGVDCKSPKQTIKEFYNLSYISPEEFENELEILDDRNMLSHIYDKRQFEEIYGRIIQRLPSFAKILSEIR